jgi:hypothetical protein
MRGVHEFPPVSSRFRLFWSALALFWVASLVRPVSAILHGRPEHYPGQYATALLLSLGSLCLALSFVARAPGLRRLWLALALGLILADGVVMWRL